MPQELDREELAWAGGYFEGEGCFYAKYGYPAATLSSTDGDPVERFVAATGLGKVLGPYNKGKHKPQYRWAIQGFEKTQALAAMLWPWLGERWRTRCAELAQNKGSSPGEKAAKNTYQRVNRSDKERDYQREWHRKDRARRREQRDAGG
jgi:hypothetical protein